MLKGNMNLSFYPSSATVMNHAYMLIPGSMCCRIWSPKFSTLSGEVEEIAQHQNSDGGTGGSERKDSLLNGMRSE